MLKAYQCTDDDLYAAPSVEQAAMLCEADVGEPCEEGYPRELSDEELDKRHPAFDEDENPVDGQTISVREMLAKHGNDPGWLAGSRW